MVDWNDERVAILKDLWVKGETSSVIGKQLGCTRNAIIGKAHRLGLVQRTNRHNHCGRPKKPKTAKAPNEPRIRVPRAPRKAPEPIVTPPLDSAIPVEQRLTIYTLEWGRCHFPVGDPATPEFFYCGGNVPDESGRRYCAAHRKRMFIAPRPRAVGRERNGGPFNLRISSLL